MERSIGGELRSERFTVNSLEHWQDLVEERGWSDGLPVIPPTEQLVGQFVAASGRAPQDSLGQMAPAWAQVTIEKLAINAVLAGCRASYMPVLVTALELLLDERFNLLSIQATTHPVAPFILISGEEARTLQINCGAGAFGPGWRANATIGRAVRLAMMNIGGGIPGAGDRSTQGGPAKYTYCVAENERDSPWEPLRMARGFAASDSVVFVAPLEAPHNINDHGSTGADELLTTIAGSMQDAGCNNIYLEDSDLFVFLGPEHAHQIAEYGFSRLDLQRYLFEAARVPVDRIGHGQLASVRKRHRMIAEYRQLGLDRDDLEAIPLVTRPEDINVLILGGAGRHSSWAPSFGLVRSVAKRIEAPGQ
jgi:hypothetical protein